MFRNQLNQQQLINDNFPDKAIKRINWYIHKHKNKKEGKNNQYGAFFRGNITDLIGHIFLNSPVKGGLKLVDTEFNEIFCKSMLLLNDNFIEKDIYENTNNLFDTCIKALPTINLSLERASHIELDLLLNFIYRGYNIFVKSLGEKSPKKNESKKYNQLF